MSIRQSFSDDGCVSVKHALVVMVVCQSDISFILMCSVSVRHTFCIDGSVSVRHTFCVDGSVSVIRYTFCIDGSVSDRHTFCIDGSVSQTHYHQYKKYI